MWMPVVLKGLRAEMARLPKLPAIQLEALASRNQADTRQLLLCCPRDQAP
jgi:hypothetical protein